MVSPAPGLTADPVFAAGPDGRPAGAETRRSASARREGRRAIAMVRRLGPASTACRSSCRARDPPRERPIADMTRWCPRGPVVAATAVRASLFGHSMGAIIAYATAHRLASPASRRSTCSCRLVGARRAGRRGGKRFRTATARSPGRVGGMPEGVLRAGAVRAVIPICGRVTCASATSSAAAALSIPITAMGETATPPRRSAGEWASRTTAPSRSASSPAITSTTGGAERGSNRWPHHRRRRSGAPAQRVL